MKQYKLKNKSTNEDVLCTKVVVDGFDYYVSDDTAKNGDKLYLLRDSLLGKQGDIITVVSTRCSHTDIIKANGDKHWFASNTEYQKEWYWKKVIATNNPSIDIGQVIDRLGIMAHNSSPYISVSKISNSHLAFQEGFEVGYNTHAETHTLSDDEVGELLEWGNNYIKTNPNCYTYKELLQLFKEQLPKTIYYGE